MVARVEFTPADLASLFSRCSVMVAAATQDSATFLDCIGRQKHGRQKDVVNANYDDCARVAREAWIDIDLPGMCARYGVAFGSSRQAQSAGVTPCRYPST
jgi:hypothetical protein